MVISYNCLPNSTDYHLCGDAECDWHHYLELHAFFFSETLKNNFFIEKTYNYRCQFNINVFLQIYSYVCFINDNGGFLWHRTVKRDNNKISKKIRKFMNFIFD